MKNKKILIVAPYQFGELSDCYYWAKYASIEGWDVAYYGYKYIGARQERERTCEGVKVWGVNHQKNRILLGLRFYLKLIALIILSGCRNIIVCYTRGIDILPFLFPYRNIILDIRTLSVAQDPRTRHIFNENLKKTIRKFHRTTFISQGVMKTLGIDKGVNAFILPLGAEHISREMKSFCRMRLLYIGTFNNRNLPDFIAGLQLFKQRYNVDFSFDIIGCGSAEEETKLSNAIAKASNCHIRLHGYLTHEKAMSFFDQCNIGVCYVPITEYYDYQPPTKLYEYLLSGMVCIATRTKSNEAVVTKNLGILIDDTPDSVCDGLFSLYSHLPNYTSRDILKESDCYHWKYIVKNNFLNLME